MTREKALEAMDKLVAMGYTVVYGERDLGRSNYVMIDSDGNHTSVSRWLEIHELSVDKIDLRSLLTVADALELDLGVSALGTGRITFTAQQSERDQRVMDIAGNPRKHPR